MADSAPKDRPPGRALAPGLGDASAHRLVPALAVAGLIVLAPLPFGSGHGWSLWVLQAVSIVAAGLLLGFEGFGRAKRVLAPIFLPAIVFVALILLQLVPLPLTGLGWLNPSAAALYRGLLDSPERWFPASANAHASLVSLVRLVAYAAVFFVVATATQAGRQSLFYWSILLSGGIAAGCAWWHAIQGWDTLLFGEFAAYQPVAPTPRLHWPLLNPNHLAAAMNVTWLAALGAFLCPALLGARPIARESQIHRTIALCVMLLAASASYGTHSRGGVAAAAAGLAILALCWPAGSGRSRSAVTALRAVAAAVLVVGVGWLLAKSIGGVDHGTVLASLQRQDATLQVRLEVFRQGLAMLRGSPLFGTGLATWNDAFPRYQVYPLLFASVTHAHCDPLEWLTDLGIIGFAALTWVAIVFVREPSMPGDEEPARRRAILAALIGSLLVHATGDFALRVPSIALVAAALLGLAWRETERSVLERFSRSEAPHVAPLPSLDLMVVTACVAVLVYVASWEWRDERLLARLAAKESVSVPESVDWRVLEGVSRRRAASGESGLRPALEAVWSAPASARAHHALAYGYASDLMRERELRRTVACAPSARFWRLEHALSLAALNRFDLARREIEEGFYYDPQFGDVTWLRFQDPTDQSWPFLQAALRGVRRRVAESPETAAEAQRFEELRQMLVEAHERRSALGQPRTRGLLYR